MIPYMFSHCTLIKLLGKRATILNKDLTVSFLFNFLVSLFRLESFNVDALILLKSLRRTWCIGQGSPGSPNRNLGVNRHTP